MEDDFTRHYGFLMNIRAVLRYALYRWPALKDTMESDQFDIWNLGVIRAVVSEIGQKTGIPDLGLRSIWIGNGFSALCWSLPPRFDKYSINEDPDLRTQVDRLKKYLAMKKDPKYFFSYMDPEPERLKKKNVSAEDVEPFNMAYFLHLFDGDRKEVVSQLNAEAERLFTHSKTTKLEESLSDAPQT